VKPDGILFATWRVKYYIITLAIGRISWLIHVDPQVIGFYWRRLFPTMTSIDPVILLEDLNGKLDDLG
jgi:hypothetical protein